MAKIFLSYAREDADRAGRVAAAMEAAGHSVWWDRHIHAGSRFSAEIDAALNDADLVVVLWSHHAVQSSWVLDEAAAGRDSGRLVPVLIENIMPPLGFRQYQAVDLARVGRGARAMQPLVDAIAKRSEAEPRPPILRRVPERSLNPKLLAIAAIVFAAPLGVWWLWPHAPSGTSPTIAISAAPGADPRRSQDLARTIAVDLGRFRSGPLGTLTILGADRDNSPTADYRVEVGVSGEAGAVRADVALYSSNYAPALWTTTVEGPSSRLTDLRQQAVAKLGDALVCAVEAGPRHMKISAEVLGLYVNGCGRVSDLLLSQGDTATLSIFRQLTSKAPDFAPGWAKLALIEGKSFPGTAPPDRPTLAKAAQAHLDRAKRLDPTLPDVFAADANFHPSDGTKPGRALEILGRGLALHPDSALLHSMRADFLAQVGRTNESVSEARQAMQLNPLSPLFRDGYISGLAYAGRTAAAFDELKAAEQIWPGSAVLNEVRYRLDLRYGDPRNALRMLEQRGAGDLQPVPMDQAWKGFLEARIDPSPANVEKSLSAFRDRYRRDPGDIPGYLQALGTFGRVDEAYRVVVPAETLDSMLASTESLFRAHMHSIRADPRFIGLADRLGLLAYWQKSGVWPDFCAQPRLPYNCKAEAARTVASPK